MEVPNAPLTCDIRTAFPRIPEESLAGLSHHEPITSLTTSTDAEIVYESIADWMLCHPSTCVGTILPGLWLARDEAIQAAPLPGRVVSALARLSVAVWGEVVEWTPSLLLDIRGFGEGSLRTFLAVAAEVSAEACARQRPPSTPPMIDSFEPRCLPPRPDFKTAQLNRLADWAVNEAEATTIGELIAACSRSDLPEDISLLRDSLNSTPLSSVFPGLAQQERLESLVNDLHGVLNSRTQLIFFGRISFNSLRTLEDLAGELGVTKERVRQLSVKAEERVREALATPRFAPIGWRAHALRTTLGMAVPPETSHFNEATEQLLENVSDAGRERVLDLLLWLAGPYYRSASTGWLCAGEIPGADVLASFCDERGRVDLERLQGHLTASGLLPSVQSVWLNEIGKIKNIEGNWLIWTGTVTDKAIRILEIWGQPATAEEIVNAINEGHDVKATRNRLFEDQRLMRVDMNRIGLRSWGLEEYSSIAEQMDQELERRGGCADLNDLIETLIERFNIRENSIRFFVNAPMFILEGNTLRRRTDADPYDPIAPVTETAGCYLLGADSLSWRVDITADTLRGSGRAIPAPIAAWLGVMPGGRRAFSVGGRLVAVSWPETSAAGPAIGSKRRTEDMLVYLALARFRGRPALSVLPRALQLDIRAFFGAYTKACSQADELLFQAGKAEIIDAACKRSPIGKLLPDALYVHRESLDYLEPVLRVYEGCGRAYIGGVEGANLIKIHRYSGKVSYLVYPDFEKDPHPALTRSVKLDMRARQLYCQDFGQGGNPPVLHRKETFLQKDHPLFEKFEKLTKQEERAGLLDETATIGTKDGWAARLAEKGFTLRGHRLVRAPQPPRSSDAAEKS